MHLERLGLAALLVAVASVPASAAPRATPASLASPAPLATPASLATPAPPPPPPPAPAATQAPPPAPAPAVSPKPAPPSTLVRHYPVPGLRWHPYLQMDGGVGTSLGSPMEGAGYSMTTAVRMRLGIFLSARFSLELEGGILSTGELANPSEGVAGHTFNLFHGALSIRGHLLRYTRTSRFVPFLLAGVQVHQAEGILETTAGTEQRRWKARGVGGLFGVGVDFPLAKFFTLGLRAVYRPMYLGQRRWDQGGLVPVCASAACGRERALMHAVLLELGAGVNF